MARRSASTSEDLGSWALMIFRGPGAGRPGSRGWWRPRGPGRGSRAPAGSLRAGFALSGWRAAQVPGAELRGEGGLQLVDVFVAQVGEHHHQGAAALPGLQQPGGGGLVVGLARGLARRSRPRRPGRRGRPFLCAGQCGGRRRPCRVEATPGRLGGGLPRRAAGRRSGRGRNG